MDWKTPMVNLEIGPGSSDQLPEPTPPWSEGELLQKGDIPGGLISPCSCDPQSSKMAAEPGCSRHMGF